MFSWGFPLYTLLPNIELWVQICKNQMFYIVLDLTQQQKHYSICLWYDTIKCLICDIYYDHLLIDINVLFPPLNYPCPYNAPTNPQNSSHSQFKSPLHISRSWMTSFPHQLRYLVSAMDIDRSYNTGYPLPWGGTCQYWPGDIVIPLSLLISIPKRTKQMWDFRFYKACRDGDVLQKPLYST